MYSRKIFRRSSIFLTLSLVLAPAFAQDKVTAPQLQAFLASRQAQKLSDADLSIRLASVVLSERLTHRALERIVSNAKIGPQTTRQLLRLSAESSLSQASPDLHLDRPAPDAKTSEAILQSARNYVAGTLSHLPDFIASRAVQSFDNGPSGEKKNGQPKDPRLHWVRESHREVAYRNGHELLDSGAAQTNTSNGLTTNGEFGQVLATVIDDVSKGKIEWTNWQRGEQHATIAVYSYSVPESASHYRIDFCCYQSSEVSGLLSFRKDPAYHGEIDIEADSGRIERVTIEADLDESDPLKEDGMMVDYAPTTIGDTIYFLPTYSVSRTLTRDLTSPSDGTNQDRSVKSLNELTFSNYHKFGSTTRILPTTP
jgi:hypothetical protein